MNKKVFIKELEKKLKRLPKEELDDVLNYYREYFEDAMINDNEDILTRLDSPSNIASQILSEYAFKEVECNEPTAKKGIKTVWFIILAIFAAPIALPLAITAAAIIFALLAVLISLVFTFLLVTVSFIGAGIFTLIAGLSVASQDLWTTILTVGISLILIGLGLLTGLLVKSITPKILSSISKLTRKLLNKFNNKN